MRSILFEGFYGVQNAGDDAFVEVSAWGAKKYWNYENIIYKAKTLPKILTKANCIEDLSYRKGKKLNTINTIRWVFNSNAIIYSGGSIFHSTIQRYNTKHLALFKKKYLPKSILGAIGVSLGPYTSMQAEKENIELLKHFDFLTLRDKASFDMAMSYNLPYKPIEAFDLAALLPIVYKDLTVPIKSTKKKLGISVCNYESYLDNGNINNELRRNKEIVQLINSIVKIDRDIQLCFFILYGNTINGDHILTTKIINELKLSGILNIEVMTHSGNVFETWSKIEECNAFLSTRLHGAIFACYSNIPFFLVEYHRKCKDFLDTIGYDSDLRLNDAEFDTDKIAHKITNIINCRENFYTPRFYNESIDNAILNFSEPNKEINK